MFGWSSGRGGLGLLQEPLLRRLISRQVGREQLDGDVPIQTRVMSLVDDAHAPAPELGDDPITGRVLCPRARVMDAGGNHTVGWWPVRRERWSSHFRLPSDPLTLPRIAVTGCVAKVGRNAKELRPRGSTVSTQSRKVGFCAK